MHVLMYYHLIMLLEVYSFVFHVPECFACMYMYMCAPHAYSLHRGDYGALDPLELEL